MATTTTTANGALLEQLVQLTEAVKQLAERPGPHPAPDDDLTDADRVRQRVAFGYQAIGTLTGRVSSTSGGREFDLAVVAAERGEGIIAFRGLPPGANWVELRGGDRFELLRVESDDGSDDRSDDGKTPDRPEGHRPVKWFVRPEKFSDADAVGSMVFLRGRRGPLIAFGPRLAPFRPGPPRRR